MRRPARSLTLGAAIILAALGYLVYQGISNNLVYYITPSELLAKGAAAEGHSFRLGGQVRLHSVSWNASTKVVRFILQDPKGSVRVMSHGQPPSLFRQGAGCVVEGTFAHGLFTATTIMI